MDSDKSQFEPSNLMADVRLYSVQDGGKARPALPGYRCPLFTSKDTSLGGWEAQMQLTDGPFEAGTERRVGFVFLTEQGADAIRRAKRFYLWEGQFIGEATVVG